MHVFVTGGSGLTGPSVVAHLIDAGHTVTGLARSDAAAARLTGLGAAVHRGSLDDLDSLRRGAQRADGVVHMAFGGSFDDPEGLARRDSAAIDALGHGLAGTGKPLVVTSGTFVMAAGRESLESDTPDPASVASFRIPGEQVCLSYAARGVRSSVVRLAPTVHGPGDYGFIPMMIESARTSGFSGYVGEGANRWPAVHRLDAAALFRLALEQAPAGTALHGVAENVTLRSVAERIGAGLGLPVRSLTPDQALAHFGGPFFAGVFAADAPASGARTRELLGWTPAHPSLLDDLVTGDYLTTRTGATADRWT
ncbi:SDR family oxidoreductase [Actinacidiphila rubida]|uniref:Nucleoside-diphosphate-sugar epimerase n=1 Tax=Actinacidiphila rubida TaxID=310780 RepID=A0A1H8KKZ5_9ACTN|nr:SDR family oxidoreductase [Actinacidiphila rubida]SEN93629.1 Nucleoside-diphosphate-sugar epimerase [Actinacidiphila rubida]